MFVSTLPDISTTGSAVQLATSGAARWLKISALTQTVRFGDSSVGSSRGFVIPAGSTVELPMSPELGEVYSLAQLYVYITSGGTCQVTYGQ